VYSLEYDHNNGRSHETPGEDAVGLPVDSDPSSTFGPVTMVVEQGQILSVQSDGNSSGKKTFLLLMARILLPTKGIVYYPGNLRVRFIPNEPLLFHDTLLANLKFGNQKEHTEVEIWELCRHIGMGEEIIGRTNLPVGLNGIKLSLTNRVFVCIARALLSSVDLLLISNALDPLGPTEALKVLTRLQEWKNNRGMLCLSADNAVGVDIALKKKKTCFFITKNQQLEEGADGVILLKPSLR